MKEKHNLTKKHPIIAILLLLLVAVLVISGSSTIILMFAQAFRLVDTSQISLVTNAAMPIFSILFMIIMKAWYSPEYKGTLKSGLSGKDTFFVCLPFIIYGVIVLVVQLIQYNFCNYSVTLRNPQFQDKVERWTGTEKNQRNVNIQEAKKVVC